MERRDFLGGLGIVGVFGPSIARAGVRRNLPEEGIELVYRLSFGGSEIGSQVVRIKSHDEREHVVLQHEISVEIRLLFAVVYSLNHQSTEIWDGLTLKSVRSKPALKRVGRRMGLPAAMRVR